jgi:antitoxin (DNA-binding transcriptional repressor) of toxin-antitoxin stability system
MPNQAVKLGPDAVRQFKALSAADRSRLRAAIHAPLGEGDFMKIENMREVKTRFSRYVKELPKSGSVLNTKNGRPCAALVPVAEDTDLEALALPQNKRFWRLIDDAIERGKKAGFVDLADL